MNKNLYIKVAVQLLLFPIFMGALLFLPAGTLDYWEAWVFVAVFFACTITLTVWLMLNDPKLLERRMKAGPAAEKETSQKIIVTIALLFFAGLSILSGFDHRFGWSDVPTSVVIMGNVLIALSYIAFYFVLRENTYAASTIQVEENQRVISTGLYALVRHPMYTGALFAMIGIPLALGSWWGLLMFIPSAAGIIWRLLDEEKFLSRNLAGYTEYKNKVRYRLIPLVW
ncbi:MAG: isoprenylcysteine carboxylmethyltransferase family protein [Blastocatellia bacterium]|nr:isoprenylcysteine carboxylmethyltransferase family protein [Blastocatellia bacterium]